MNILLFLILISIFVAKSYGDQCVPTAGAQIQQITNTSVQIKTSSGLIFNADNKLYFVERDNPALWIVNGRTAEPRRIPIPDLKHITAALPTKDDPFLFVALADHKLVHLKLQRDKKENVISISIVPLKVLEADETMSFTYCKVDKKGRLYIDVAPKDKNTLQNKNTGKLLQVVKLEPKTVNGLNKMKHPQGIGFTSDFKKIFLADSEKNVIFMHKYEINNGTIGEGKIVFNLTSERYFQGSICSLTVTKSDLLWIGLCESGTIILYDWEKKQFQQIHKLPAKYPIWLEMGDPDLTTLFIGTDASFDVDTPAKGAVFAISGTGVKGQTSQFLN